MINDRQSLSKKSNNRTINLTDNDIEFYILSLVFFLTSIQVLFILMSRNNFRPWEHRKSNKCNIKDTLIHMNWYPCLSESTFLCMCMIESVYVGVYAYLYVVACSVCVFKKCHLIFFFFVLCCLVGLLCAIIVTTNSCHNNVDDNMCSFSILIQKETEWTKLPLTK